MSEELFTWGGWIFLAGMSFGYWCGRSAEALKWIDKADAVQAKERFGRLYRVTREDRRE